MRRSDGRGEFADFGDGDLDLVNGWCSLTSGVVRLSLRSSLGGCGSSLALDDFDWSELDGGVGSLDVASSSGFVVGGGALGGVSALTEDTIAGADRVDGSLASLNDFSSPDGSCSASLDVDLSTDFLAGESAAVEFEKILSSSDMVSNGTPVPLPVD